MTQNILISLDIAEFQAIVRYAVKEELKQHLKESEPKKSIFNVGEAAKYLSLSKQSIYNKVSLGELVPCKREGGRKLYFERDYLENWLLEGSPRHQVSSYLNKKGVATHV